MIKKNIQISETLGNLMKNMDGAEVGHTKDMFKFYMEQYEELRVQNNAESVASAIHDSVDSMINESLAETEHKISCSKGCSFCCFQKVDISDDEATLLLAYSKEIGYEINMDKLKKQAEAKDEKEFMDLHPRHRRCVFLNQSNECAVYQHRPSSCRKLIVVSEPDLCDTVKHPNGQIGQLANLEAEVITSSTLNVRESGSLAEIILKQIESN